MLQGGVRVQVTGQSIAKKFDGLTQHKRVPTKETNEKTVKGDLWTIVKDL